MNTKRLLTFLLLFGILSGCGKVSTETPKDQSSAMLHSKDEQELVDDSVIDAIIKTPENEDKEEASESYRLVTEEKEQTITFSDMPGDFVFSSGAGAWATGIEISRDGSFSGQYHDSDMGASGDGYPNGTVYISNFSGKFSSPEPTDNPYIFSMKLLELTIDDKKATDTEEISDGILYVYTAPYGFENADEFLIYLPGASLSDMPDECQSWTLLSDDIFQTVPDGYFVIYNVGGQEAFTAQSDDSEWDRDYKYSNGKAYVTFTPSYYMGSTLSFFMEEKSPAALSLMVPWDGKSPKTMECKKAWQDDDGTRVKITIEPADGSTSELRKYVITAESVSDSQFDFSAWGSNEADKFSAVFIEQKD